MKKHCLFLLFISLSAGVFGQGSRFSANFAGTAANEHVNFGNTINGELNTSSFTLEIWVKPRSINGDPSIVSNKDWDSGNNTGFGGFSTVGGGFGGGGYGGGPGGYGIPAPSLNMADLARWALERGSVFYNILKIFL